MACEFSGAVRRAFVAAGHEGTTSVDYLPSEDGADALNTGSTLGFHVRDDIISYLRRFPDWDLMICHPPCQHLAVSGARWFKEKRKEQERALAFVQALMDAPIKRIALENPISVISTKIRKPDQIIQPWMFGHGETKATCLWLKNLPKLVPTNIVDGREARVHRMAPGPDRWKERSRTLSGIAKAMAEQWGNSA